MRAVVDSGSKVASSDGVGAGCDVERCSDKASARSHLPSKQSSAKKAKARGEQRDGLGDACGTKHDSSRGFIGNVSFQWEMLMYFNFTFCCAVDSN